MTTEPTLNDGQDQDLSESSDAVIGQAFFGSIAVFVGLAVTVGLAFWCLKPRPPKPIEKADVVVLPDRREAPAVTVPRVTWSDITEQAGIDFVHCNGAAGEKLLPETMGSGCAFLDYDSDGDADLLFINSCHWDESKAKAEPSSMKLYQNDGTGRFSDQTEAAGLSKLSLYGMGVACGDYDNDGRVDVFISCLGRSVLLHNLGGRFEDVTETAGVGGADRDWSTSCGWFDYDNDGDLDLLVCHYIQWSRELDLAQEFQLIGTERGYGRPAPFGGTFPTLFRNDGQGKFSDVSETAGLKVLNPNTSVPMGKSLGLVFEDFNDDGNLDFVVANDTVQNFLFLNQGNGSFEEMGAQAGIAFDSAGAARGAMGIDAAAYRNDSSVGIGIGNFANEMTALYVSRSRNLQFYDAAVANGLGPSTRLQLSFAVLFLDFDLDGRLDILQANGHLEQDIAKVQSSQTYAQPTQLFWNAGPEHTTEFLPCSAEHTGPEFPKPLVGRGAAYADIDGDGDLDVVVSSCGQKPMLLRNENELQHHWLRVRLIGNGQTTNREGIGAIVSIRTGDTVQRRVVNPTRSYLSQVELPVTFGLAKIEVVDALTVTWPDGSNQSVASPAIDQQIEIRQPAKP